MQYRVTPRSIILIIDSAQFDSARSCMEIRKNMNISVKMETKFETILTRWSVAQTGSNDEKTRSRKSRWTVPLKVHKQKFQQQKIICAFHKYEM